MSYKMAFDALSLDVFRKSMDGIYSVCVSMETIDESAMVYNSMGESWTQYRTPSPYTKS